MTTNEEHLSMFELDLFFASNAVDARIAEHVAGCERCSGYLAELDTLQQNPPSWATRRGGLTGRSRRSRPRARVLTLAAALAVLGGVTFWLVSSRDTDAPLVAIKGSPAVQLLVRRGEETRSWDGASSVQPGDALGLRVACEGFSQVTVAVASQGGSGDWAQLFSIACPSAGAALPFTLVVDEVAGRERVAVVFSRSPFGAAELGAAIGQQRLDAGAWVTRFELDKEVPR